MNSELMEHRWGGRVQLDAAAELRTAEGMLTDASVRNASLSGAFVETDARLPLLSRVSVRSLAKSGEWLDACVVRVEDTGMAVEWMEPGLRPISVFLSGRRQHPVVHAR
jgi:hypothetical protein